MPYLIAPLIGAAIFVGDAGCNREWWSGYGERA
jgi:hypothetical protein